MKKIFIIAIFINFSIGPIAGQRNIAPLAKASVSDSAGSSFGASSLNDGIIMKEGIGEWACNGHVVPWGIMHMPWARLDWDKEVKIDRIVLYDRVCDEEYLAGGTMKFSDGSEISVTEIPNDGTPKTIVFPAKKIKWICFEATDGKGKNIGLSEIEVFASKGDSTKYVEWVNPYIESTRGRWFFCTPGSRPMGMVAAHAFTRNKNQGGGGYNYNFNEILGFTQINGWMVSGLNIMPVTGCVNPLKGMEGWKSKFSHQSETIQPGYHKLYLDRYKTWVEYTATERVAFYRMDYNDNSGKLLVDIGSVIGNCTMANGILSKISDHKIIGQFQTIDRFWGGPDNIDLYFVLESDIPFKTADGWNEKGIFPDCKTIAGKSVGMILEFNNSGNSKVMVKMAISYTSVENAEKNLEAELSTWNFDGIKEETQKIWNEMLGRIYVKGGTVEQKTKFYTDLWHVLLGRHKINDISGDYPDYTHGKYRNKRTSVPMRVKRLQISKDGTPLHNMYSFDGLWLSQWNLNVLWGLAWPEILDDFSACLIQYADNGGLLPRGACAGGYSFIMTGCPATSMIVSTYMKGLLKKVNPKRAFNAIKRNHLSGGMLSYENPNELEFYIKNGYCPGNAGKTIQWAFEDWGLAQMAKKLGKNKDAKEFDRRSHGWKKLFDKENKFIHAKDAHGKWIHRDPLNGQCWIEANSWQGTWSVSHDLTTLVELMGGGDEFCAKLDYAFHQAELFDFVYDYSKGYVSYANQPGCSNAHLFSYGGQPWQTQYWVRKVQKQAYGSTTPDKGYGGHDEDQGQMGGISALMSIGLFSVTGNESEIPYYDITSPIFDTVIIKLNNDYYPGKTFTIKSVNNSTENCYIQRAELNNSAWNYSQFEHSVFANGGTLKLWLGDKPNRNWGKLKYFNHKN